MKPLTLRYIKGELNQFEAHVFCLLDLSWPMWKWYLSYMRTAAAQAVRLHNNSAATWQNQQSECVPSEDSDQPGHPPSLIRIFAVRMKKAWVISYPLSAQQSLWSDWADAQADLSLRWAHTHLVGFYWGGSYRELDEDSEMLVWWITIRIKLKSLFWWVGSFRLSVCLLWHRLAPLVAHHQLILQWQR